MPAIQLPARGSYQIPAVFSQGAEGAGLHKREAVVLCHGISTDKNEYLDFLVTMQARLNAIGVSTLRFDFRGHGESALSPDSFSIGSQVVDLLSAVHWLHQKLPDCRVSFLGVSFGAPPCLMIDRWLPGLSLGPRFLIAPVLSYSRTFLSPESNWAKETFYEEAQLKALEGHPIQLSDSFYMTGELLAEMSLVNLSQIIENCPSRIYVMHGVEDDMVPFDASREMAVRHTHVELTAFQGMEHGFTAVGDETGTAEGTVKNIQKMIDTINDGLQRREP